MEEKEQKELINLCRDLIQINSTNPPGNEKTIALFCEKILTDIGVETEIIQHSPRRASLLALLEGASSAKNYLFLAHLDTVPVGKRSLWKHPPFSGDVSNGRIWGRGSADMKGGLAALLYAARSLKDKKIQNTMVIALTADEESTSLGAKTILSYPSVKNSKMLIIPEPTSNRLAVAEKGVLWIKIVTIGKSAHGALPEEGINAIEKMMNFWKKRYFDKLKFDKHPLLGNFSYSLNTIKGGIKTNIVPDTCEITIDIRTLPDHDQNLILASAEETLNQLCQKDSQFKYQIKTILRHPAIETPATDVSILKIKRIAEGMGFEPQMTGVNYYSDASILIPFLKIPFLLCGPGDPAIAHGIDESLEVAKLSDAYHFYKTLINTLAQNEF